MKMFAGFALAGALALLPAAHAQLSCDQVDELMELAWDDFETLRGAKINEQAYETDYWFKDAEKCFVGVGGQASTFGCMWVEESGSEADAVFEDLVAAVDGCLRDWPRITDISPAADPGLTTLRMLIFVGEGDYEGLEWIVAVDRHDTPGETDWHISLSNTVYH